MTNQPNAAAQFADFEFAALSQATNYRAALLRDFHPHLRGNVLEVGAGIGQITEGLLKNPQIRKLLSIEPESSFCNQLRARFPQLDLLQGTVDSLQLESGWNAILSINVLEHIETDTEELASYHRLLHPTHGVLCLFVPARPEIYAPLDKDFGHFRRYTKLGLRTKLATAGFRITRCHYYNFWGYFAWWLSFCLLKKRSFDVAAVQLYDRMIFPVSHWLELHICPPPIGQSLLVEAIAQ
jgi:SAM-dependent methyltransferase